MAHVVYARASHETVMHRQEEAAGGSGAPQGAADGGEGDGRDGRSCRAGLGGVHALTSLRAEEEAEGSSGSAAGRAVGVPMHCAATPVPSLDRVAPRRLQVYTTIQRDIAGADDEVERLMHAAEAVLTGMKVRACTCGRR